MNSPVENEDLTVSIHAGTGFAGPALATVSQKLTPGLQHVFVDFLFDLDVTTGAVYSAQISATNARWGIGYYFFDNIYDGGAMISGGSVSVLDTRFRATFADAAIPVPAALPLLASGLGLMAAVAVRRRRG